MIWRWIGEGDVTPFLAWFLLTRLAGVSGH